MHGASGSGIEAASSGAGFCHLASCILPQCVPLNPKPYTLHPLNPLNPLNPLSPKPNNPITLNPRSARNRHPRSETPRQSTAKEQPHGGYSGPRGFRV